MNRILAALAVLIVSLVLAPTALAHHPVGTATQTCNTETGTVELSASFDNPGFDTAVTATDSIAGDLGTKPAPATFELTVAGPDRAAGTVVFDWQASDGDHGTVEASYAAVSGCEAPPPPTTTTTTPPPPPPAHHSGGGPTPRIGTPTHGRKPREATPATPQAEVNSRKTLPYTGYPLVPLLAFGIGLPLAGAGLIRRYRRTHGT